MAVATTVKQHRREMSYPIDAPDRRKFEEEVAKITRLIKEKEKRMDFVSTDNKDIGEELSQLGAEADSLEESRSKALSEIKSIDEELRQLGSEIAKHKGESNRLVVGLKYMTEGKYVDQIRKLESELQSRKYALKDERTLQNEIASLKEAKLKVSDYLKARESVNSCRDQQDRLRKRKDSLHHQVKGYREKLNATRDKMGHCRHDLDRRRGKQREKKAEQESINKEIGLLYNQRRQLLEEFRQHQLQYMEAMKSASPEVSSQTGKIRQQQEEHRNSRESKRKTRGTKLSNSTEQSYEEEHSICRALFAYFSRVVENRGGDSNLTVHGQYLPIVGGSPSSLSPENSPTSLIHRFDDVPPSEGEFKVLPRKKETEEEWLPSTKRRDSIRREKRKSRKEKKATAKNQQKPLQLNATVFEQFTRLGLQPPVAVSDVPLTLGLLKEKMIFLETRRHSAFATDSEAGDSGIMSSTGISEFSECGNNDLNSGEVTPNTVNRAEMSPLPTTEEPSSDGSISCVDSTPVDSIKGSDHVQGSKTDTEGSASSDISTPTGLHSETGERLAVVINVEEPEQ